MKKMAFDTTKLKYDDPIALVTENPMSSTTEQTPIYLEVDWQEETIIATTYDLQRDGMPMAIYHDLISLFRLPDNVNAYRLKGWVDKHALPLIEQVAAGFSAEWDGSNMVGSFPRSDEGRSTFEILDDWFRCEAEPPTHEGGLMHIRDWLLDADPLPESDLSPLTTDEEIETLATRIEADAAGLNYVLAGDICDTLRELRDDMQEEAIASLPDTYEIEGYEVIEKTAKRFGNSGHVAVPCAWVGHRVKIVRVD
jgi:putative transposon-encoded protein